MNLFYFRFYYIYYHRDRLIGIYPFFNAETCAVAGSERNGGD